MKIERIKNKNRHGNEAEYYNKLATDDGGGVLLTDRELRAVKRRWDRNPEDHTPEAKGIFGSFFSIFS